MKKVMRLLPMRFTKKLIKILIILLFSFAKVNAKPTIEGINLFSFKHNDQCIYFFDFSLHKKKINKLKSKKKDQFIINLMIESLYNKDFKRCEDVNEILFKAVMIEDRDNYGRPDFSSKIDLLDVYAKTGIYKLFDEKKKKTNFFFDNNLMYFK